MLTINTHSISLITVCYNSSSTILDTLLSINSQTYPHLEHIIIDGGSKDDTMTIVKAHGKRLTTVISEPDRGIYDAFNKGLSRASGEVVGFLNSDDVYANPDVISLVMDAFGNDSVDAVYADLIYVRRDNLDKITRYWKSRPYQSGAFSHAFVPPHPTLFLRRRVYERIGGFDTTYRLAADYEYMLRAFHTHGIRSVYLPKILVKMRAGGATGGALPHIRAQNVEILEALSRHAVPVSRIGFFLRKAADRLLQRTRALFVKLPE